VTGIRTLLPSVTWRRPDPDDDRPTVPYSWAGWGHLHARRWQYWPPWGVTARWRPRVMDACDGERASKLVVAPLLGAFVWFFNRACGHSENDE
jgi:hypothetical protein